MSDKSDVGAVVEARAIWLRHDLITVPADLAAPDVSFRLLGHPSLVAVIGRLTPTDLEIDKRVRASSYRALRIGEHGHALSPSRAQEILRGPLLLEAVRGENVVSRTGIQVGPVLDHLYPGAVDQQLGVTWRGGRPTLRIWAPTATSVHLLLRKRGDSREEAIRAVRDEDGVWSVAGDLDWEDAQYRWEVIVFAPSLGSTVTNRVTDPYSIGLTVDSRRSVIVNRDRGKWKPAGWDHHRAPELGTPASQAIYELHVRDFSAWDQSVPEVRRGTYAAFAETASQGVRALRSLADAGMTSVHLLPTFDISSDVIPEDRRKQRVPQVAGVKLVPSNLDALEQVPGWSPSSEIPQAAVAQVRDVDAFNWGYDPWHWMTPEGSYATDGNQVGGHRTREYRQMVKSLHQMGLRVVQDVVFNHTFASGQQRTSILDKVVPGYYHRLCLRGRVENSTCCANVATERRMAQKLMVDAVVDAAVTYRIDGFRFDLMGHHSLDNLRRVRQALDALTVEKDGVDGQQIYLYGEGWNFGEVANDALFIQATQNNIGGTGIGVFNDRLRDAVRGGSVTGEDARARQGFATGLLSNPNEVQRADAAGLQAEMFAAMDLVKVSLVGAIKDYRLRRSDGSGTTWSQNVDYFGQGAAFADEPSECVNYVEAHDDTTLYDFGVWKLPLDTSLADRVKAQVLANALVALGQGVAFWAAGTELLRSKSLDRDSYNSGDWFNAIDWSGQWNQFGCGLPSAARNQQRWEQMRPLLSRQNLRPDSASMHDCQQRSLELLRIRAGEPLLTLGSADEIRRRVHFLPTSAETGREADGFDQHPADQHSPDHPGVIAMWIDGRGLGDGHSLLVTFNAQTIPWTQELPTPHGPVFSEVQALGYSVQRVK